MGKQLLPICGYIDLIHNLVFRMWFPSRDSGHLSKFVFMSLCLNLGIVDLTSSVRTLHRSFAWCVAMNRSYQHSSPNEACTLAVAQGLPAA